MKVLFISRYGSVNLGDELIVRELEELILEYSNEIYRFDTGLQYFPSLNKAFIKKKEKLKFDERSRCLLYLQKFYNKYLRLTNIVSYSRNILNKKRFGKHTDFKKFESYLAKSDILIIGGGNLLFDMEEKSESAFYIGEIFKIAKELKKEIFVISAGIGPFQTIGQLNQTIKVLDEARFITVRDKVSYSLVQNLNKNKEKLFLTVDPVAIIEKNVNQKKYVSTIGINVMDLTLAEYSPIQYQNYLKNVEKVIRSFKDSHTFNIIVFITEVKDLNALIFLQNKFSNDTDGLIFDSKVSLDNLSQIYSEIDILLGTRMHSMIYAFSQLVPYVGVAWQPKISGFNQMIGQSKYEISMGEFLLNEEKAINYLHDQIQNFKEVKIDYVNTKEYLKQLNEVNRKILTIFQGKYI